MTYSHNITAFALSLTFDLASIRFKVRPFKLLRTPSPHDLLPRLPILRILSEQAGCFLLGAEQHNKRWLLIFYYPVYHSLWNNILFTDVPFFILIFAVVLPFSRILQMPFCRSITMLSGLTYIRINVSR